MRYDSNALIGINFSTKAMFLFLMISMILLPFVAEKKLEAAKNIDPPNQGALRAEMFWDDSVNTDIDLWVDGPVGKPIGFSNLGGPLWNLLRDDLGRCSPEDVLAQMCSSFDASERNMEIAYTRGIYDGEYVINARLFNLKSAKLPIKLKLVVSYKETLESPSEELFFSNVELTHPGHELTVFRFFVRDSKVDIGSLNRLPKLLSPANTNQQGMGR